MPTQLRETAASALAHVGGSSSERFWRSALGSARRRWHQTHAKADASVLDRLIYSLGMSDQEALLHTLTTDPTLPDRLRNAARWWTTLPRHILDSARS